MALKRLLLFSLLFTVFFLYGCSQSKETSFSISGTVRNQRPGPVSLFREDDVSRKKRTLVARLPVDDRGAFRMDFELEPHLYTLELNSRTRLTLAIDKGQQIEIEGDAAEPSAIRITGSADTDRLAEYEKFRKESLNRLVISVRQRIKTLEAEKDPGKAGELKKYGDLEVTNYEKHKDELNSFIKERMGTSIAVYATTLRWEGEQNLPFFERTAAEFEKAHPNLAVTARIKEKVAIIKATANGGTAPEIMMPDRTGKNISLSSVRGRYTLIDFWASWCGPCRRESAELNEAYERFKSRGFEIYGVSLDDSKDAWLNAIAKDDRNWTNVSTLEGFETPASFDYAVTALPAKFLIDKDGRIIAKDLNGPELLKKLKELYGKD